MKRVSAKNNHFWRASLFIFGRSYFVRALVQDLKDKQDLQDLHNLQDIFDLQDLEDQQDL